MIEANQFERLDVVIHYTAEMDEFWSFVETKSNQRWTWCAMGKKSGLILARHNGKRTNEDFKTLLPYLSNTPINRYYTDDWGAYSSLLPENKHVIGKAGQPHLKK